MGFSNLWSQQFISKLQPDLSAYVYSTTLARPHRCRIFLRRLPGRPLWKRLCLLGQRMIFSSRSVWSGGTFGMPVTPDAIKRLRMDGIFISIVIKKMPQASYMVLLWPDGWTQSIMNMWMAVPADMIVWCDLQAICANCGGGSITLSYCTRRWSLQWQLWVHSWGLQSGRHQDRIQFRLLEQTQRSFIHSLQIVGMCFLTCSFRMW